MCAGRAWDYNRFKESRGIIRGAKASGAQDANRTGHEDHHDRNARRRDPAGLVAAAIFWYDRGLISQGEGAEIAGLTRAGFLRALSDAKVDALQVTPEELKAELERTLDARR